MKDRRPQTISVADWNASWNNSQVIERFNPYWKMPLSRQINKPWSRVAPRAETEMPKSKQDPSPRSIDRNKLDPSSTGEHTSVGVPDQVRNATGRRTECGLQHRIAVHTTDVRSTPRVPGSGSGYHLVWSPDRETCPAEGLQESRETYGQTHRASRETGPEPGHHRS